MRRTLHWLLASTLLVVLLGTAGCSSSSSPPTPSTSPGTGSPAASTAASDVQVIKVAWAGGKPVVPSARIPVKLGSKVRLEVTSDVDEIVHLHFNDAEQDVAAGGTVIFTFTADKPGVYDVEVHKADQLIVQLQIS